MTIVRLFVLLLALAMGGLHGAAKAQIVIREILATGHGGDASMATKDAIEAAIAQVGGMRISTATWLSVSEVTQGASTAYQEHFRQNIEKITRGVIKSYTVLESGVSPGSGRAFVKIKALIPTYQPSDQLKRLKLAVAPITLTGPARERSDAPEFAEMVSAAIEAHLTQTRKFAMIDRRYTDTSNRELSGAAAPHSRIEESARMGARVGADYLVLAALKSFSVQQQTSQRVTGRMVAQRVVPVALDVRVIDVASGQIKFAQTYLHPGRMPASVTLAQYATDIGADIGQIIGTAIYPIAVVGGSETEVTLNQGGDTVQLGRVYRLVRLGQPLVDPYTRESLGQEEHEFARAEVTSVTDRTATARVVSGRIPLPIVSGALLARILPDEVNLAAQVTLPALPGIGGPSDPGKAKPKENEDW